MSGRDRTKGPRTKDALTVDERALWDHAAASMQRLRHVKDRVLDGADAFYAAMAEGNAAPLKRRSKADKAHAKAGTPSGLPGLPAAPEASKRTVIPPVADFDRKSAKRLRSGQAEIEARIDLHGMRQHEAHDALQAFLMSCQARGKRFVLVITGKGAPRRNTWSTDDDATMAPFEMGDRELPGVLRRNVPRWLSEPDLRPLIVSWTEASPAHGGTGALYIQLRRQV